MTISYNLLKEPWLPCIDENNKMVSLNLIDVVSQAHQIKEIQGTLPIITGALHLFLIAFTKNILALHSDGDWEKIWQGSCFPADKAVAYSKQWGDRFNLFDDEHPFYQDKLIGKREKDIENMAKGKNTEPKGVSGLLMHMASGNNATLFDHSNDELPACWEPAELAQLLITWQAFSLGGMSSASISKDKYYKDSPFARGILFLNRGKNLFETILLNVTPKIFDPLKSINEDKPAWEMEDVFEKTRFDPNGMLDFLTWQSRRILLLPEISDDDVCVKHVLIAPGHGLVETNSNPYYHNRIQQTNGNPDIKPMRFQQGRALWRDSSAILDIHANNAQTPLPIQWSAHLQSQGIFNKDMLNLELLGMCTQPGQKKVYFYAYETFFAPVIYLENDLLRSDLEKGLEWAEQVRSNLYLAVRDLARYVLVPDHDREGARKPGRADTDPLIQHWNAESHYWGDLEQPFYDYLLMLPVSVNAHTIWQDALKNAARKALRLTAEQVGTNPTGLKARARAERSLNALLYKTFNPDGKEK